MAKPSKKSGYDASDITVLEGLDAVRKRPGMYIGSTDGRGLAHCLWELLDNAVDEAIAGYAKNVEAILHPDGSFEVIDDGRGIPVDVEKKSKLTGVELVMTKLHAGGKFGGSSYQTSGGLHGVGASVVNALSARLDVEVDREGKIHLVSFRRGIAGVFDSAKPDANFTKKSGLRVAGKVAKGKTGTRVRFWPDRQIFTSDAQLDIALLHERARQTAFLVSGLNLTVTDLRNGKESVSYKFQGGIAEFVEHLASDDPVTRVIRLEGVGKFNETVPVMDEKGHLLPKEVEREMHVDIALRWGVGYDSELRSFVNVVSTPKGGTHVQGFERALTKTINDQLKAQKVIKPADDSVLKEDILEGLTAVISVRVPEPQFEGQTKEILGTPAATRVVANVVSKQLGDWLAEPPRGSKNEVKSVLEKIANAARARIAARTHRDIQRKKTAVESSALPAKLVDCRSRDIARNELFVVEGESALGTAKLARDSEFQALLPIRGKVLNVQKASFADMLKNAECASIIQVIGGGSAREFDLELVRYGKIVIMTDADVDGAHIRSLLLTLFHRYLKPLLDDGRIYAAMPPLHRIEVVGSKEVHYTYSDAQMQQMIGSLTKAGKRIKDPIQRYKGLGEMDAVQLRDTTMSVGSRSLRRVSVQDAARDAEIFELLMGSEVAPRKDFIIAAANSLDRSKIDA
ncbi:MAG: type IIA DNA topoisomerase subunit B [Actinobacteria bacterium]|nr:type IIA DNA topoisomerase subunit B [Actinomycetota bacterium]